MDTTSTIIGLVMLLIAAVPIFILTRQRKKRTQRILSKFEKLINKKANQITSYQIWNDRAIGLSKASDQLFYVAFYEEHDQEQTIDLSKIKSCRVHKNQEGTQENAPDSIRGISLVLSPIKSTEQEFTLDFYSEKQDGANLNGELQIANKWAELINNNLMIQK